MKQLLINLIVTLIIVSASRPLQIVAGGISGGGGTPPSVELDKARLQSLQDAALKGDLIRITQPGADPVYLRPDLGSMKIHSFSANALPSGQETVFYAEPPAEKIQTQIAFSVARSMKSSMGTLPVLTSDFDVRPQINVEAIAEGDIDDDTVYSINASAIGGTMP